LYFSIKSSRHLIQSEVTEVLILYEQHNHISYSTVKM